MQNSNDAKATHAQIHFTAQKRARRQLVTEVVYRNNGQPFKEDDWKRLCRIAEGNPDPDKIGAFGVGFYTAFSISDAPLIVSGDSALAFRWEGDTLMTRLAPIEAKEREPWTSFVFPCRELQNVPDLTLFGEFLCASVTFTASLRQISVFLNEHPVLCVRKDLDTDSSTVPMPPLLPFKSTGKFEPNAPNGIVKLLSVCMQKVNITVELGASQATLRATLVQGSASTAAKHAQRDQIMQATRKNLPKKLSMSIFIPHRIVAQEEPAENNHAVAILSAFIPRRGNGKIFIGFRTSQTTGLAAHIGAPLVPTVEREAIDMQNGALRALNTDILYTAGSIMRLWYESSVLDIVSKSRPTISATNPKLTNGKQGQSSFMENATVPQNRVQKQSFAMKKATGWTSAGQTDKPLKWLSLFPKREPLASTCVSNASKASIVNAEDDELCKIWSIVNPNNATPDASVGVYILSGFTKCITNRLPVVVTSSGLALGPDARLACNGIETFVNEGIIKAQYTDKFESFLLTVAKCSFLSIQDLENYIKKNILSEEILIKLLHWWVVYKSKHEVGPQNFFEACRSIRFYPSPATMEEKKGLNSVVFLSSFKYFVSGCLNGLSIPLPRSTLPTHIQAALTQNALEKGALKNLFVKLPFRQWALFAMDHECMTSIENEFESKRLEVLRLLSLELRRCNAWDKECWKPFLFESLHAKACIPSIAGEKRTEYCLGRPSELYLSNTDLTLFQSFQSFKYVDEKVFMAGVSQEFLKVIGVRTNVSPRTVLSNLSKLQWDNDPQAIITFLRSVSFSEQDLREIRATKFLPGTKDPNSRFAPCDLYLPLKELSQLQSINFLRWPDYMSENSPDARYLEELGCKGVPSLEKVLLFASTEKNLKTVENILLFAAKRLSVEGAYEFAILSCRHIKCIPAIRKCKFLATDASFEMETVQSCFDEREAGLLGFPIVYPELDSAVRAFIIERFKIPKRPPVTNLVDELIRLTHNLQSRLPEDLAHVEMKEIVVHFNSIFQYFGRLPDGISSEDCRKIKESRFIPHILGESLKWLFPKDVCFTSSADDLYKCLFITIPYNSFLSTIGVKQEPTGQDLLEKLDSSSERIFEKLGYRKYHILLLKLASQLTVISITKFMRHKKILLGHRNADNHGINNESSTSSDILYELSPAVALCIADDNGLFQMFQILQAPPEVYLYPLYEKFGVQRISEMVSREIIKNGQAKRGTASAKILKMRLLERRCLLLSAFKHTRFRSEGSWIIARKDIDVIEMLELKEKLMLGQQEHIRNSTCLISHAKTASGEPSLLITKNFTWADVGHSIGSALLTECGSADVHYVSSILKDSLKDLRDMGLPVEQVEHEKIFDCPQPEQFERSDFVADENRETIEQTDNSIGLDRISSSNDPDSSQKNLKYFWTAGKMVVAPAFGLLYGMNLFCGKFNSGRTAYSSKDIQEGEKILRKFINGLPRECSKVSPDAVRSHTGLGHIDKRKFNIPEIPIADMMCDQWTQKNLVKWNDPQGNGKTVNGMLIFCTAGSKSSRKFLLDHWRDANRFSLLLEKLGKVLSLSVSTMAIFHDESIVIAFNKSNGLYFNLLYFTTLHINQASVETALGYWFVVMCHELAHNVVKNHSRAHAKATESICKTFLPSLLASSKDFEEELVS